MEGMNYLTAGDLALHSQEMRGGGYDGYYGCHRSGKGMAATGIGLAAGLGGAALFGVLLAAWGFNNASQARAKAAEKTNAETITNEVARLDEKIDDKTYEINVAKE